MIDEISHLAIILTNKCNLNCRYCLRDASPSGAKEVPFEVLKEILSNAKDLGYKSLGITGGEALLYSRFEDLIKLMGSLKFNVFIESNGILLNEAKIDFLRNNIKALSLLISLDSADKAHHDRLRGVGSFDHAIKAIRLLKARGVSVQVNCVVTKEMNPVELTDLVSLCRKLNVDSVSLSRVIELGKGNENYSLSEKHIKELKSFLESKAWFKGYVQGHMFHTAEEMLSCQRLTSRSLCISPEGIHPCIFLTNKVLGDLTEFNAIASSMKDDYFNNLRCCEAKNHAGKVFSCPECKNFFGDKLRPSQLKIASSQIPQANTLSILLTNNCNQNCYYCLLDCNDKKKEHLDFKILRKLLIEAKELGFKNIQLNGGEPLNYPRLRDALNLITELDYTVSYLITDGHKYLEFRDLLRASKVSNLFIGLDGMHPEIHDKIRGNKDSFAKTMHAILEARKDGFNVGLHYVMTKENVVDFAEFLDFVKEKGINQVIVSKIIKSGRAAGKKEYDLNKDQLSEVQQILKDKAEIVRTRGFFACSYSGTSSKSLQLCDFLNFNRISIDWKGRVNLCSVAPIFPSQAGNLAKNSFLDCLIELNNMRNKHVSETWPNRETWHPEDQYEFCEFCLDKFS